MVIEAFQIPLKEEGLDDAPEWFTSRRFRDGGPHVFYDGSRFPERYIRIVTIPTREGTINGYPGDYIIQGVQGEIYPCGDEIFNTTYEAV